MTKNIFFDYDGTLINSQKRIYKLFCELCPENNFSEKKFTYEEYWEIKRTRINQKDFLKKYFNYSDEQINEFKENWLEKIEEEQRLSEDKLIDNIDKLLEKLALNNNLYLVTNRQFKDLTIKQIKNFGLFDFFDKILITEQRTTKVDLIKNEVNVTPNDVFIGDTGEDILSAKGLGIKSIAASYGFLNKEVLAQYKPDLILDEVKDFDNCKFI